MNLKDEVRFQTNNFSQLKGKLFSPESYREGKQHRISCIALSEKILKTRIKGQFIELGSGTGYFSAYLLANRPETFGTLLECTDEAKEVIQNCMKVHSVNDERYEIYISDFNEFSSPKPVGYVFAMGAIHHSYALGKTMKRIYENLKPGGYLIANEPAFDDFAPREHLQHHYQQRLGVEPSKEEPNLPRYDFFFRECEYRRAAISAGLDLVAWIRVKKRKPLKTSLKLVAKSLLDRLTNKNSYVKQNDRKAARINSYLMIFRKPDTLMPWIPHKSLL